MSKTMNKAVRNGIKAGMDQRFGRVGTIMRDRRKRRDNDAGKQRRAFDTEHG